ncbi:MAG: hypothetical protein IJH32_06530 [Ruminococcus sp.]|nr:hypothetical protein [Ruminococcus sp.]
MSCLRNQIVLRVPCAKYGIKDSHQYLKEHQGFISWNEGSFAPSLASLEEKYIDYIIHDQPLQYSDYEPFQNEVYHLTKSEKERYRPIFQKIIPDINMDDVHECRSCWYDGVEAPDIY